MDRIPERQGTVPTVDGAQIAYRCFGGGTHPLVLLHGNGEDYTCFQRQLEAFSEHFWVIAIDSRGHGSSTVGEAALTIDRMGEDVAVVLDALEVERTSLLGFSDGGNVAIAFALRYPQRVDHLILAGANLNPAGVKRSTQIPIILGYWTARFCGLFSRRARHRADILRLMVREPHFRPEELSKISAPTLVLAGDHDLIRPEHTRLIAVSLPNARLEIVSDCDHFLFEKQPEAVNRIILHFLEQGIL